jgi:hypothetical protein
VIVFGIFEWKDICTGFLLFAINIYFPFGNPVIKKGGLGSHLLILTEHKKYHDIIWIGNPGPGLEKTQECGKVKLINGIPNLPFW